MSARGDAANRLRGALGAGARLSLSRGGLPVVSMESGPLRVEFVCDGVVPVRRPDGVLVRLVSWEETTRVLREPYDLNGFVTIGEHAAALRRTWEKAQGLADTWAKAVVAQREEESSSC